MFAQKNPFTEQYPQKNPRSLTKVLNDYKLLAGSDPHQFRHLLPAEEIWRFFVDGVRMPRENWIHFESREKRYLKGLYKTFALLFHFDQEINSDFICELHGQALEDVEKTNYQEFKPRLSHPKRFRMNDIPEMSIFLQKSNTTLAGIKEFLQRQCPYLHLALRINFSDKEQIHIGLNTKNLSAIRTCIQLHGDKPKVLWTELCKNIPDLKPADHPNYVFQQCFFMGACQGIGKAKNILELAKAIFDSVSDEYFGKEVIEIRMISTQNEKTEESLLQETQRFIKCFYQSLYTATSDVDKLYAIAALVQSLEQLHPFLDANCRTLCMALCNHLLLVNGFPPAIFYDPNCFDCFSRSELVEAMIQGMENTIELIRGKKLFSVKTADILKNIKDKSPAEVQRLSTYFSEVVAIEEEARMLPKKKTRKMH
jgi:hypothetical protein